LPGFLSNSTAFFEMLRRRFFPSALRTPFRTDLQRRFLADNTSSKQPSATFDPEKLSADDRAIFDEMKNDVQNEPVVLFIKGEPSAPRCGFSKRVVDILGKHRYEYLSYNVLTNEIVRQGTKHLSDWPTIPQLFVQGKFVGGADIIQELDNSGELATLLTSSGAPQMSPPSPIITSADVKS